MSIPPRRCTDVTPTMLPGASVVHAPSGALFTRNAQGDVLANLPQIKSVGITDLTQVLGHQIVCTVGLVSHHVRFAGGGELRYAYNTRGELIELYGFKVEAKMSPDGQLFFEPLRDPR